MKNSTISSSARLLSSKKARRLILTTGNEFFPPRLFYVEMGGEGKIKGEIPFDLSILSGFANARTLYLYSKYKEEKPGKKPIWEFILNRGFASEWIYWLRRNTSPMELVVQGKPSFALLESSQEFFLKGEVEMRALHVESSTFLPVELLLTKTDLYWNLDRYSIFPTGGVNLSSQTSVRILNKPKLGFCNLFVRVPSFKHEIEFRVQDVKAATEWSIRLNSCIALCTSRFAPLQRNSRTFIVQQEVKRIEEEVKKRKASSSELHKSPRRKGSNQLTSPTPPLGFDDDDVVGVGLKRQQPVVVVGPPPGLPLPFFSEDEEDNSLPPPGLDKPVVLSTKRRLSETGVPLPPGLHHHQPPLSSGSFPAVLPPPGMANSRPDSTPPPPGLSNSPPFSTPPPPGLSNSRPVSNPPPGLSTKVETASFFTSSPLSLLPGMATPLQREELSAFLQWKDPTNDRYLAKQLLSMFTIEDVACGIRDRFGMLPKGWREQGLGKSSASMPVMRLVGEANNSPSPQMSSIMDQKINEILDSEDRFVKTIVEVQTKFVDPLFVILASGNKDHIKQLGLSLEEINQVFSPLRQICRFSQQLLQHLDVINIVRKPPVSGEGRAIHVGQAFLIMAPKLHVYAPAITSFQESLEILDRAATKLQTRKSYPSPFSPPKLKGSGKRLSLNAGAEEEHSGGSFLALWDRVVATNEVLKGKQLNAVLITPMQRIPRYKMLLEALLKDCQHGDEAFAKVSAALMQFERAALHMNEAVKTHAKLRGFFGASSNELRPLSSTGGLAASKRNGEMKISNTYTNKLTGQ